MRGRACCPLRSCDFQLEGLAGPTGSCRTCGSTSCSRSGSEPPGRRRGRARRPRSGPTGAERPRQPAGPGAAGARARPRGRRRGGDGAQPGLDGRGARHLQGRRRVPADRAALPGRPHRDRAVPGRVPRWCSPSAAAPRRSTRRSTTLPRCRASCSSRTPTPRATRRRPRHGGARPTSSPTSTSPPAPPGEPKGAMCEHAGMLNHLYAKIDDLGVARRRGRRPDRAPVLRHLAVAAGGGAAGRRPDPARRAGGDPGRRAVRRHGRGRAGGACCQVVPSYLEVVVSYLEQQPPRRCRTCAACRPPGRS